MGLRNFSLHICSLEGILVYLQDLLSFQIFWYSRYHENITLRGLKIYPSPKFYCGKIDMKTFTIEPILNAEFLAMEYINILVWSPQGSISKILSSWKVKIPYQFNKCAFIPVSSPWQQPFFLCDFQYSMTLIRSSYTISIFMTGLFH